MQHGAVLGGVDALTGEHGGAMPGQIDLLSKPDESVTDLIGEVVLREIGIEICGSEREALGATRIIGEPGTEVNIQIVMQPGEVGPGGNGSRINGSTHTASLGVRRPPMGAAQREIPAGRLR